MDDRGEQSQETHAWMEPIPLFEEEDVNGENGTKFNGRRLRKFSKPSRRREGRTTSVLCLPYFLYLRVRARNLCTTPNLGTRRRDLRRSDATCLNFTSAYFLKDAKRKIPDSQSDPPSGNGG